MLRETLVQNEVIDASQLIQSPVATVEFLELAHDPDYIRSIVDGSVPIEIIKRIGFPWSPELFNRVAATVGGAARAAEAALRDGVAGALAGGTHHAHFDRGEGYCVFNDVAVVSRWLVREFGLKRIAVIDLDVHQGNGNSSILGGDREVFIASIHGEKNYPFRKVPSTIDIGLADGATDDVYLEALVQVLSAVEVFEPQYIFYQMGVDPLTHDKLGKLDVSFEGLMERDRRVLTFAKSRHVPLSLALGGGYSDPIDHSVAAYANTYRVVNEVYRGLSHGS